MKFLLDNIEDEDRFGGHHSQIVNLLSKILTECDQPLNIALLGERGSGKSTILNLLDLELKKYSQKEFSLIIYDAWIYQHEQTRRSFLTSIYSASEKILNKKSLCFNRQYISLKKGNRFAPYKKENNILTRFIIFAGLVLLLFSNTISHQILTPFNTHEKFNLWGFIGSSLSFLVIAGIIFFCKPKSLKGVGSIFKINIENENTINSSDMEQHDFGMYFKCLCRQYSNAEIKPIFVLDNLDRIVDPLIRENILCQIKVIFESIKSEFLLEKNEFSPSFINTLTPEDGNNSLDRTKFFDITLGPIDLSLSKTELRNYFEEQIKYLIHVNNMTEKIPIEINTENFIKDIYKTYNSKLSSYDQSPRGAKRFINDLIVELLINLEINNKQNIDNKVFWKSAFSRILPMYVAIKNMQDRKSYTDICWRLRHFEAAYRDIFRDVSDAHFFAYQGYFHKLISKNTNQYQYFKNSVGDEIDRLISEAIKNPFNGALKYDYSYTYHAQHLENFLLENINNTAGNLYDFSDLRRAVIIAQYFCPGLWSQERNKEIDSHTEGFINNLITNLKKQIEDQVIRTSDLNVHEIEQIALFIKTEMGIKMDKESIIEFYENLGGSYNEKSWRPLNIYFYVIVGLFRLVIQTYVRHLSVQEAYQTSEPAILEKKSSLLFPAFNCFQRLILEVQDIHILALHVSRQVYGNWPPHPDISIGVFPSFPNWLAPYPAMDFSGFIPEFWRLFLVWEKNNPKLPSNIIDEISKFVPVYLRD